MAQNRSYDPPIATPPDGPPQTITQVNTESTTSAWGAISEVMRGGMGTEFATQKNITGKGNSN